MNEMYEMSQGIHIYSLIAWMSVLLIMIIVHKLGNDFKKFVKTINILMILYITLAGFVVLTGTIMMAAKHLSFTPANLLMILSIFIVATLEIKRNKALAKVVKFKLMDAQVYARLGFKYQVIEFILLLGVGAFSGMASAVSF